LWVVVGVFVGGGKDPHRHSVLDGVNQCDIT
jgi:hypothetical protein